MAWHNILIQLVQQFGESPFTRHLQITVVRLLNAPVTPLPYRGLRIIVMESAESIRPDADEPKYENRGRTALCALCRNRSSCPSIVAEGLNACITRSPGKRESLMDEAGAAHRPE